MLAPAKWPGRPEAERLCVLSLLTEVDAATAYAMLASRIKKKQSSAEPLLQEYLSLPRWRQKSRYDWLRSTLAQRERDEAIRKRS